MKHATPHLLFCLACLAACSNTGTQAFDDPSYDTDVSTDVNTRDVSSVSPNDEGDYYDSVLIPTLSPISCSISTAARAAMRDLGIRDVDIAESGLNCLPGHEFFAVHLSLTSGTQMRNKLTILADGTISSLTRATTAYLEALHSRWGNASLDLAHAYEVNDNIDDLVLIAVTANLGASLRLDAQWLTQQVARVVRFQQDCECEAVVESTIRVAVELLAVHISVGGVGFADIQFPEQNGEEAQAP